MRINSFARHCGRMNSHGFLCITLIVLVVALSSCYSFRGGSVPAHLKTITIASVVDNSGYGDPTFRELATDALIQRFRGDNSLQVTEDNGDARLTGAITRIQDAVLNVQGADLESQRQISVTVEVEYFDAVKNRTVWKQAFQNFDAYDVADATVSRQLAVRRAINRIADDVLLKVVSDW